MITPASDKPILVPVANPSSAPALLHLAADLAGDGGLVHLLTIISSHASTTDEARAWTGLRAAEALAEELGVTVRGRVRTASDPAAGVLEAIADDDPALVVMGWRGTSSSTDVFGELIDHVVGRSSVPLAVVRLGQEPTERLVLPVSAEHLLPGGGGSLSLAADLIERLRRRTRLPTTVLRTGPRDETLPTYLATLGDRVHHDPRRTHRAVEAFARSTDLIVAAVAPTASGLRAATTHLAWAAPDSTLVVAVDVGPVRGRDLVGAVAGAGHPAPPRSPVPEALQRIVVTVRLADAHTDDRAVGAETVERILRSVGETDLLMAWWPDDDDRAHVGATVTVSSEGPNRALATVMTVLHDAPELAGAEITYELDSPTADQQRPHAPAIQRA